MNIDKDKPYGVNLFERDSIESEALLMPMPRFADLTQAVFVACQFAQRLQDDVQGEPEKVSVFDDMTQEELFVVTRDEGVQYPSNVGRYLTRGHPMGWLPGSPKFASEKGREAAVCYTRLCASGLVAHCETTGATAVTALGARTAVQDVLPKSQGGKGLEWGYDIKVFRDSFRPDVIKIYAHKSGEISWSIGTLQRGGMQRRFIGPEIRRGDFFVAVGVSPKEYEIWKVDNDPQPLEKGWAAMIADWDNPLVHFEMRRRVV